MIAPVPRTARQVKSLAIQNTILTRFANIPNTAGRHSRGTAASEGRRMGKERGADLVIEWAEAVTSA